MMPPLLGVEDLQVAIPGDEGVAQILDRVSFDIPQGGVMGLAGESGCGKSTLVKAILGILPSSALVTEGRITFDGKMLADSRHQPRQNHARKIGFIPQDPFTALNPVFKIGTQLMEILRWSGVPNVNSELGTKNNRSSYRERLIDMLTAVQLQDPAGALEKYPHQFSGGQRQRILIAAALAPSPKLILADEPTTALDVTTQQEILGLLKTLIAEQGMSMLFVSHDFGVISQLCSSVSVMYAGQTVETGPTLEVLRSPRHPYTRRLLECHPDKAGDLVSIPGQVPSPFFPPHGCRFSPRCDFATSICSEERPAIVGNITSSQKVGCVLERDEVG